MNFFLSEFVQLSYEIKTVYKLLYFREYNDAKFKEVIKESDSTEVAWSASVINIFLYKKFRN